MNWIELTTEEQLDDIRKRSHERAQVIFKHSSRCGISALARSRLEKSAPADSIEFYFLDLIRYRQLSTRVAEMFNVYHESPQILLIKNGECIYDESHLGINMRELEQYAA